MLEELPVTLRNREPLLEQAAGQSFFNTSRHTFATLLGDPDNVAGNLRNYIAGFSESARDIVDKFNFDVQIDRLDAHNLLYLVVSKFADIDLSPETVSNLEMGYLYEELIRKFSELSNETAGRALHAPRGDPADGEPAVRRRRRAADPAGRGEDAARPGLRHRRDAVGRRGSPAPAQPSRPA